MLVLMTLDVTRRRDDLKYIEIMTRTEPRYRSEGDHEPANYEILAARQVYKIRPTPIKLRVDRRLYCGYTPV